MRLTHKVLIALLFFLVVVAGYSFGKMVRQDQAERPSIANAMALDLNVLGKPRPEFTLPDLNNDVRSVSEWDGKVLMINFWATWCGPCREEIPILLKARQRYRDQGFEILGIALDRPEMLNDFIQEMRIDYPVLYIADINNDISRLYGNMSGAIPYSVFIGKNGLIEKTHQQGVISEAELDAIIAELIL